MEKLLKVENLTLIRDEIKILRGIDLNIGKREIHALLGINGVGKSSLAYCLMGLSGYKISGGRIYFEGMNITDLPLAKRAKLGITLSWQEPTRFEGLTVRDYLSLSSKDKRNSLDEILSRVALKSRLYLKREMNQDLSGGERKRIELASVYAMQPKLAILDEPDSGIDMLSLQRIMNFILSLRERGASVLLITHREEVVEVADTASLMCEGEIVKSGDPKLVSDYFKTHCQKTCFEKGK
ncbi:MAG: ABC transporter ATP-binding protein [Candidatus Aerophobetes bacterium]|nr:ABC transporter ATP-binding protein [Candidatus Aerophobetes bacterium]